MGSCLWGDSWPEARPLSMAGNARRGPHCIGIVFLCQEWRQWGLFFAGRNFGMKLMSPSIRQNVFLVADHSAFLELLTLQKGPIVPFSVTTPLLDAFCVLPGVALTYSSPAVCPASRYARPPSFAAGLSALSLVVCDPPPPLMLACFSWRSFLCARVTPLPFLCGRLLFLLPPHAESPLRLLRR